MAVPPPAGPSTTQGRPTQLPVPTAALLAGLASAHSTYFPRLPNAVHPETSEITTPQQRQDAEQKIALLKSVLGGWMQGVEMDLERKGADLSATLENLVALSETLPGSFCGIKAKPRFLLYTTRSSPSSTARLPPSPSLINGSPRKDVPLPVAGLSAPADIEGVNPEEDLATFLTWRCLAVSTALQAALLSEAGTDGAPADAVKKVQAQRQVALNELQGLMEGVLAVLCESAVRVEWKTGLGKEVLKDGGVGKAREMVEELLKAVQAVSPAPSQPPVAYPRSLPLFASSRAYQPSPMRSPSKSTSTAPANFSAPRQPSVDIRTPLHARSMALVALKLLLKVTAQNEHLADYRPLVIDLLVSTWPTPSTFGPASSPYSSVKGKERAADDHEAEDASRWRLQFADSWMRLVRLALDRSVPTWAAREILVLSVRVLDELNELVHTATATSPGDGMDVDGASSPLATELDGVDLRLLDVVARLWIWAKDAAAVDGADAIRELRQLAMRWLQDDGERAVLLVCSDSEDRLALKLAILILTSLPLVTPTDPAEASPIELLSPDGLARIDEILSVWAEPPMPPLPPTLAPYHSLISAAYSLLVADHDARSAPRPVEGDPPNTVYRRDICVAIARKRRRFDEIDPAPSSDGLMDLDGPPPSTAVAKRRRGPWKEAVGKVLQAARELEENVGSEPARAFAAEGEAAEQTVVRLAKAASSAPRTLATIMLRTIGLLSCARSGSLVYPSHFLPSSSSATSPSCSCCDASPDSSAAAPFSRGLRTFTREPLDALATVFGPIFAQVDESKDDKLRLALLNALVRVLKHTTAEAAAVLYGEQHVLGMAARELEGPSRSGRMAAGNVVLAVAQARQEHNAQSVEVEDLLRLVDDAFDRDSPAVTETTLQLLGKLARAAEPQGLLECESLARLLARFGHRNAFIKSTAKLQLTQTAAFRNLKPYALVQPHFAVLSTVLIATPATLSAALDCFHQSRESLLRITREHTLPSIVLHDQRNLLQQVADASYTDIPQMLCEPSVASAIVAHLYMQPDEDRQRGLKTLMREARGVVLSKLLEAINVPLVYKLALELGSEDPHVSAQAERALKGIERTRLGHAASTGVDLSDILKSAIVGILSHMNRGLRDAAHHRPLREKQKIIRSLGAITTRVGRGIAGFSPQIMATLQTALELPGLRLVTLNAFGDFLRSLKFSDIGPFIGPTTAAFVRLWPDLTPAERASAKATIDYLVVENADNLTEHNQDVADLSGIEGLEQAAHRLQRTRTSWSFEFWCGHLLERISGENDVVSLQALRELKVLLEKDTASVQKLSAGDTFDSFAGRLVAVLLGAAVKDGPENELIRNTAFDCLGILGALDPDRFELPPVEEPPIVLENFQNYAEAVEFALRLIQDLLVGAYRSTNDTKHQEFLAYAIQELLHFCGFSPDLLLASSTGVSVDPIAMARWSSLPKTVIEACAPLLSTRFSLGNLKPMPAAEYPIYSSTSSYRDWIRTFANDLLGQVSGSMARQVFNAFSGLLHLEDTVVAGQLLPHLLLSVLIRGTESARDNIKREMETVLTDQVSPTHALSDNSRLLSAQTVFSLMDHLSRWITLARKKMAELKALRKKTKGKTTLDNDLTEGLVAVEGVLQDIPHILVGQAALTCKSYARSLLNFESHIIAKRANRGDESDKDLQVYFENLHECYAHLDEPDGMEGISTKILSPSVLHQIREHESTGRWTSAQSCWEVKLQQKPDDPVNHVGLLRCLRNLGHYDSMRTHIVGLLHSRGDEVNWERILAPFNIEASLFVGDWDSVADALDIDDLEGPEAAFGRVLCAMREGDTAQVERAFYEAREQLGGPIVAAGRESYRRVYDSVIHLHILDELKAIHLSQTEDGGLHRPQLVKTLKDRLALTSPSFRAREPILNLRRTALRLAPSIDQAAKASIGELWLETSKIARKAGHFQTAYSAILQARDCNAEWAFLQSAKLFHSHGETHKAVQELDNRLKPVLANFNHVNPDPALVNTEGPTPLAKAALRRARWLREMGRVDQNEAVGLLNNIMALAPYWATPYFALGHFWDQLAEAREKRVSKHKQQQSRLWCDVLQYQAQTVKLYVKSLAHGTKYIYQALPRLLTIWLENGERQPLVDLTKERKKLVNEAELDLEGDMVEVWKLFGRLNSYVKKASGTLPPYQWLTVLPQLVSRILHANDFVYEALEQILIQVLISYPHHGFWAMASGAKSNTARRSKRNLRVFQKAKNKAEIPGGRTSDVGPLVDEGLKLVDQLLNLCNFPITGKTDSLSLKKTFPNLYRTTPTKLIIPLQSSLTVTLPSDNSQSASHKPFPASLPVFSEFDDAITVMSSLQKPRKITVRGDDGRLYSFLCKPKDDLRKDARLMEFNSMIIKLLKKDSEARSRKLNIRTYSVVPINEECGLIEWVPHVVVLRGLLNKAYTARGIASWGPELKKVFDTIRDDPRKTGTRFEREVLTQFPSVFHDWFLENFPEPSAWHRARLAYSRTAAVISIVGFVLGLGDRHCENILLDGTTGDTVHVDFNCLFDKGRTFEVAEKVPFRLTHNIIDGMGVTGVEGVFRRSAEITLRILRANKDSLRSVLETFMHDPLVEWAYVSRKNRDVGSQPDQTKARALEALEPISNKLMGLQVTSDPDSLGAKEVSVEEQVERLIREARDPKNLGSMYVGWCAWY
ncbi:hypothetical protein JCM10207_005273 [Rhodosporidiobolus poonsookiae]